MCAVSLSFLLRWSRAAISEHLDNFLGNYAVCYLDLDIYSEGLSPRCCLYSTNVPGEVDISDVPDALGDGPALKQRCFEDINECIDASTEKKKRVLVHCRDGFSLAPTCIIQYLMVKQNMRLISAYELLRAKYPVNIREFCSVHTDLVLMTSRFNSCWTECKWDATKIASTVPIYVKRKNTFFFYLAVLPIKCSFWSSWHQLFLVLSHT
uniref:protein-tyrosine-phosphatase n=1 Tax=Neogobius melanostomus TaxID=47308 RepID=A0A8C6SB32_9GOBI